MSFEGHKITPGEDATPQQVLELAEQYLHASKTLYPAGLKGKGLSRAPYRLIAIQAIELYLNAYLMACGHKPASLRGMGHDVGRRCCLAVEKGLTLREKTKADLIRLATEREYSIMRYGPELKVRLAPANRMNATLDEVAKKVVKAIESKGA